ncbi:MAG: hypothetical protein RBT02_03980 [Bacteroidales bacterium]|jgi:hypothetical protein|nr:hypothetical protein [Bacteroidales bacterium]
MDELERHIISGREKMDIHDPDPRLWQKIEAGLPGRERHLRQYLWRAAVAVIIAGTGMAAVIGIIRTNERINDPQVAEVRETYHYYDSRIKTLYEEAAPLLTSNPEISNELDLGMSELDSLSAEIIDDLHDNIASREVIEALIGNYRLRIELLEDMLQLMKEYEQEPENTTGNEL